MGAHGHFLQLQGADDQITSALSRGDLASAPLDPAENALLEWVGLLTLEPYRNSQQDVERVREAGWTDDQLGEAVYITALFAFFNRVADGFGLQDWSAGGK